MDRFKLDVTQREKADAAHKAVRKLEGARWSPELATELKTDLAALRAASPTGELPPEVQYATVLALPPSVALAEYFMGEIVWTDLIRETDGECWQFDKNDALWYRYMTNMVNQFLSKERGTELHAEITAKMKPLFVEAYGAQIGASSWDEYVAACNTRNAIELAKRRGEIVPAQEGEAPHE
jgi:hypothetical protein